MFTLHMHNLLNAILGFSSLKNEIISVIRMSSSFNQSGTEVNYDAVHQHQVCCETVSYKCAICCVITCVIKVSRQILKLIETGEIPIK